MTHSKLPIIVVSALLAGGALTYFFRPQGSDLPVVSARAPQSAPAMCPWRDPAGDMASFFPGSSRYQTETVALSRRRQAIIKRLGPETPLESNTLYVNRIFIENDQVGVVLVRRASGQYGAIDVVAAVDTIGRVVGIRVQRHREPKETANVITSDKWLSAFRGKSANSGFSLGSDLPAVPTSARASAEALARSVRGLLIEYAEGAQGSHGHIH